MLAVRDDHLCVTSLIGRLIVALPRVNTTGRASDNVSSSERRRYKDDGRGSEGGRGSQSGAMPGPSLSR
jgi:hypothetical protein